MNEIDEIKKRLKVNKWWYHLPIIGNIVFAFKFEFWAINQHDLLRKNVRKYKSLFNLISSGIAIILIVCFFVFRGKNGVPDWPWFFWVGLGIAICSNSTPYISVWLYTLGLKRYAKTSEEERFQSAQLGQKEREEYLIAKQKRQALKEAKKLQKNNKKPKNN